jgi:glycosyltransferase involved in cell wall biosynthesis
MISIITPSFQQLRWLRLATGSVADQEGIDLEHIVQDAGTEGIQEMFEPKIESFADAHYDAKLFVEKDAGMYDAVNRGLVKASGEICAYLNCDEQYLPGALASVAQFFDNNPQTDVVFGHVVIVDPAGEFIAFRKAIVPRKYHIWVSKNLPILTCATFFRRRVFEKHGLFFDPKFKDVGDADWVMRMLNTNIRMAVLPMFTSTFTETEQNRNLAPTALREKADMVASAPLWTRALRQGIIAHHRWRRLVSGAYWQKPFAYSIYTIRNPSTRTTFGVARPTSRWRR